MTATATMPPQAEPLPDFQRLDYLAAGSADQRRALALLLRHDVLGRLAPLECGLAGTFPLDIQIEGSDLDILIACPDPAALAPLLDAAFSRQQGYRRHLADFADGPALVTGFALDGVPVELFAQALPLTRQMAWRHLLVEARLLAAFPAARNAIRTLKRRGLKTEPAFARLFGLEGDAYLALLRLESWSDEEVRSLKIQGIQENS